MWGDPMTRYLPNRLIPFLLLTLLLSFNSCGSKKSDSEDIAEPTPQAEQIDPQTPGKPESIETYQAQVPQYTYTGEVEQIPEFKASELLEPAVHKSEYHEVEEVVHTDCFYRIYDIKSNFGEYKVESDFMLNIRVNELRAIAELKEISGGEALVSGVVDSAIDPFRAAVHIATNPVETVTGLPGGIMSLFKRAYYAGESVVTTTEDIIDGDNNKKGKKRGIVKDRNENVNYLIDWYLGVRSGERNLAKRLGVDPYTSNAELAAELKRVGKYERIGKIGTSVVKIPISPVLGVIKNVDQYVWEKDHRELEGFNKNKLRNMGMQEELIESFFESPYFSPTFQTTIVLGLEELGGVENREELLEYSFFAESIPDARYYTAMIVLMVWYHQNVKPFQMFMEDAYIPSGLTTDNKIITLVPGDYICWSKEVAEVAYIHDDILKDVKAEGREYWFATDISERTKQELSALGWEVIVDKSLKQLGTPNVEDTKQEAAEEINKQLVPLELEDKSLFDKK